MEKELAAIPQEYPNGRSCSSCEFMGIILAGVGTATRVCRKLAPRVFAVALPKPSGLQWVSTSAWPDVAENDWCGDYQKRAEQPVFTKTGVVADGK